MADNDLRNSRTKFNRVYSEEELARFSHYVEQRAACRPAVCTYGARCWVALGPPGLTTGGRGAIYSCAECGGRPVEDAGEARHYLEHRSHRP
jgi:hypothetical protein